MPRLNPADYNLEDRLVSLNPVAKVHKGGRTRRWSALVVVGDPVAGVVGLGLGKAAEVPDAIAKAVDEARKSLIKVNRLGSTIPHEARLCYNRAEIMLRPASPGTGVIAGGAMRALVESAGIRDLLCKSFGSPNPINIARATMLGLKSLRTAREVAQIRGKSPQEIAPRWQLAGLEETERMEAAAAQAAEEAANE